MLSQMRSVSDGVRFLNATHTIKLSASNWRIIVVHGVPKAVFNKLRVEQQPQVQEGRHLRPHSTLPSSAPCNWTPTTAPTQPPAQAPRPRRMWRSLCQLPTTPTRTTPRRTAHLPRRRTSRSSSAPSATKTADHACDQNANLFIPDATTHHSYRTALHTRPCHIPNLAPRTGPPYRSPKAPARP